MKYGPKLKPGSKKVMYDTIQTSQSSPSLNVSEALGTPPTTTIEDQFEVDNIRVRDVVFSPMLTSSTTCSSPRKLSKSVDFVPPKEKAEVN